MIQARLNIKMWDSNTKKMYYPENEQQAESIYECLMQQVNWNINSNSCIKFDHIADGRKFLQCTGLKDGTKWKDLSEDEKIKFYNSVCSEDGVTIKYAKVEDVQHLWNGKLIYEGDIVKKLGNKFLSKIVFNDESAAFMYTDKCGCHFFYNRTAEKLKILGNVYETPEIMMEQE